LIYDDASTDNSISHIQDYIRKYNFIRLIKGEVNKGTGNARYVLVENSKGEYICFFDDDDFSLKNRVELQLQTLIEYKKIIQFKFPVFCYATREKKYFDKTILFKGPGLNGLVPKGINVFDKMVRLTEMENIDFGAGFPTCSFFASIKDVKAINSFDKSMRRLEDIDFAVRAGFKQSHFIGTSAPLVIQKHTNGNHKTPVRNYFYEKYILDKNINILKRLEYKYLLIWLKIRCSWFSKKYLAAICYLFKLLRTDASRGVKEIIIVGLKRILHEVRSRQI
jgi:glycosyltransferase involved in cell wall biosynthesis